MPLRVIAVAVLLGTASALAEDHPASGWREALAVEFETSHPSAPVLPPEPSPLRPGAASPEFSVDEDPDAVPLPTMYVPASRMHRELTADLDRAYAHRKSLELSWQGGPLIKRQVGPVRFGVYSILFVPVLVQGSITW